jgi:hypothetical protein
VRGRQLLAKLGLPEPWQGTIEASLRLIDELEREIGECERDLRRLGADHRYVPLLCTVPGISWVPAYTIAAELGDISGFASPRKLAGYSGLCPRVYQSGERDLRGPLSKQGPRYLRRALVEAATHACTHPAYGDRYQQTKTRIGTERGAKVAQIDLARRLTEAIWHMLTRNQPFGPKGTVPHSHWWRGQPRAEGLESGEENMNESGSTESRSVSELIDERIAELGDWRGETLSLLRTLIKQAAPEVVEEIKWRKPSNPAGVPVWCHDGNICTGETYKNNVRVTFPKGALLDDPKGLFNASLKGNALRAIVIHEGDKLDAGAFKALIRAAVSLNTSARKATPRRAK